MRMRLTMDEPELGAIVTDVRRGRLSRRTFARLLLGLGLTAPVVARLLPAGHASARSSFVPSRRGGGGQIRLIYWQAPVILNPHLALGVKDRDARRVFYEPLAADDQEGNLVPVLAAELPSPESGGVARDALSVTWRLKRGVSWHDGRPFTADDVVFTWEHAADPASAALTSGLYREVARIADLNDETLVIARAYGPGIVTFQTADAYSSSREPPRFDAGLAALWLSHVDVARLDEFVAAFHSYLRPGAPVVMFDERATEERRVRVPSSRMDEVGNRYEKRTLLSGDAFEIIKNFFGPGRRRDLFHGYALDFTYRELRFFWALEYRTR